MNQKITCKPHRAIEQQPCDTDGKERGLALLETTQRGGEVPALPAGAIGLPAGDS